MSEILPARVDEFRNRHPEIWDAFTALATLCHDQGGPLDDRSRRLVKLALSVGAGHEGAVHSASRRALEAGLPPEALFHVGVLAITTLGWPAASAAMTWIDDVVHQAHSSAPSTPAD